MNALRPTAWLLSSLLALAGTGCSLCHEPDIEPAPAKQSSGIKVRYAQTYCADRWGQAPTPQQLETAATTFLNQQGISLVNAYATQAAPAAVCNACACTTGVVLEGEVSATQLAAIQALGFTKI